MRAQVRIKIKRRKELLARVVEFVQFLDILIVKICGKISSVKAEMLIVFNRQKICNISGKIQNIPTLKELRSE